MFHGSLFWGSWHTAKLLKRPIPSIQETMITIWDETQFFTPLWGVITRFGLNTKAYDHSGWVNLAEAEQIHKGKAILSIGIETFQQGRYALLTKESDFGPNEVLVKKPLETMAGFMLYKKKSGLPCFPKISHVLFFPLSRSWSAGIDRNAATWRSYVVGM